MQPQPQPQPRRHPSPARRASGSGAAAAVEALLAQHGAGASAKLAGALPASPAAQHAHAVHQHYRDVESALLSPPGRHGSGRTPLTYSPQTQLAELRLAARDAEASEADRRLAAALRRSASLSLSPSAASGRLAAASPTAGGGRSPRHRVHHRPIGGTAQHYSAFVGGERRSPRLDELLKQYPDGPGRRERIQRTPRTPPIGRVTWYQERLGGAHGPAAAGVDPGAERSGLGLGGGRGAATHARSRAEEGVPDVASSPVSYSIYGADTTARSPAARQLPST